MSAPAVRDARREELETLGRTLGRAFYDDPIFEFMLPNDAKRERSLPVLFRRLSAFHLRRGDTVHVDDDVVAGALWAPPDRWKTGPLEMVRFLFDFGGVMGTRLPLMISALGGIEKQHPTEPHWYLGVLGTDPDHQGKGLGAAAMSPTLEKCDADGIPAYLESSKESNIPFYERYGFRVTGEHELKGLDEPMRLYRVE